MYSFLVTKVDAAIKPAENYDWFTYTGPSLELPYRGSMIAINRNQRFGVRKSANQRHIRLVLGDDVNKVFTVEQDVANKLAKHIKRERI